MEDIRPKGAWYAVYLNTPTNFKTPVVNPEKLAECLPHGSGIDGNWTIQVKPNGDITVHGEYHAMNENGFYCGWRNFRFSIRRCKRNEYHALSGSYIGKYQVTRVKGKAYFESFVGGGDARDYLYDHCYIAVADALDIHSMECSVVCNSEELARVYS